MKMSCKDLSRLRKDNDKLKKDYDKIAMENIT